MTPFGYLLLHFLSVCVLFVVLLSCFVDPVQHCGKRELNKTKYQSDHCFQRQPFRLSRFVCSSLGAFGRL